MFFLQIHCSISARHKQEGVDILFTAGYTKRENKDAKGADRMEEKKQEKKEGLPPAFPHEEALAEAQRLLSAYITAFMELAR